eukprot:6210704-Pleurochrysis_carterae.AAC.2
MTGAKHYRRGRVVQAKENEARKLEARKESRKAAAIARQNKSFAVTHKCGRVVGSSAQKKGGRWRKGKKKEPAAAISVSAAEPKKMRQQGDVVGAQSRFVRKDCELRAMQRIEVDASGGCESEAEGRSGRK